MDTAHIISDLYALCGAGKVEELRGSHVNINAMDRLAQLVTCGECNAIYERALDRRAPGDKVAGYLMVGISRDGREVVIDNFVKPSAVDKDGWQHIVFSASQAWNLAQLLADKASEVDKRKTSVEMLDAVLGHAGVIQYALESNVERIAELEELIRKAHGPEGCECFKGTWPPGVVCEAHRDLKALAKELQEIKDDAEASKYDENA